MVAQHDYVSCHSPRYQRVGVSVSPTPRCVSVTAALSSMSTKPGFAPPDRHCDGQSGLAASPSRFPRDATRFIATRRIPIRHDPQESPIRPA